MIETQMAEISHDTLTRWAESCLRINHLNTLVQRENGLTARAADLSERARRRAWELFNEMIAAGASKPEGYRDPDEN
jgi:hypothetical protein